MRNQRLKRISSKDDLTKGLFFVKLYICKRVVKMREKVILICEECLSRNYTAQKKKEDKNRLEVKKYCKHCEKHTLHKESK